MTADAFRAPAWFRATTLAERLARLRAGGALEPPADPRRAAGRLQRWHSQLPFRQADYFQQRLATDGLTEEELLRFLGESAESVAARGGDLPWLAELERACAGRTDWPPADLPEDWRDAENIGFLDLVAPLLARARQRVRAGVRALADRYPQGPFDPDTVEELLVGELPGRLRHLLARTLVLELNVARLGGLLAGDTPEERFASFLERLRRADTALALLQEYPVLARQLVLALDTWATVALEFLGHLAADWEAVRGLLPGGDPGPLVGLDGNAGDTHRGGRAVVIARFASGGRVVYKPKALAIDRHFQELLAWVEAHADLPPLRKVASLDRGSYTWVEFIEAGGCDTEAEVRRFYRRLGGFLALLYALEAVDFHSENLLAAGEHPILLDLEALFHPRIEGVAPPTRAAEAAHHALNFSVLRVGLLPRLIWANEESAGMDVSGMGATGGQLSPHPVPLLEGVGTDSMRLVRKRVETVGDRNRPTLGDADVVPADYADDFVAGFESVYRLLQQRRDELLAPGGPLAAFADDEIRVIIRETLTYTRLLHESYHPDVLRDALDRDRLLDRLWVGIAAHPYLRRTIPAERADLLRGDIPMFTSRAAARDLWTSDGERLPDFFTESGLDLVEQRLRGFSDADLARQRWIVRASLATTARGGLPSYTPDADAAPADRAALLAAAAAVGDRLDALALRAGDGAAWLGLHLVGKQERWVLDPLGGDLGGGLPGVAVFLAYLGRLTGEPRYTTLAQAAATTLREAGLGDLGDRVGFDGWGGVVYTLAHLGVLWDRPDLLAQAAAIVAGLPPAIDKDEALDVLSGSAGCLAGLLALDSVAPNSGALAVAVRCGSRLLEKAQHTEAGVVWPPYVPACAPLTGFARGVAGIAWALLELAGRTGDTRFRRAAARALAYERSVFSTEAGNWPDYRGDDDGPPAFGLSWAHGAPGIGLARLATLSHLDDATLPAEIAAALRTTRAEGFHRNHSLGHGDLGGLELLLQAGPVLGEADGPAEVARRAGELLASIRRDGWLCAVPHAVETPGLLHGLAGIGLGLLRLAAPERVPSVLLLAPPSRSGQA